MANKALSRDDRKQQILTLFQQQFDKLGEASFLTIAGIGQHLGLSASQKLRDIVTELVIAQKLDCEVEPVPGVCQKRRIYRLPKDSPYRKQGRVREQRRIVVNHRNRSQEMLWKD